MDTVTVHYWPTEPQDCGPPLQPISFILTITLILSSCTALMLCTSVWTDHWENIEWDFHEVSYQYYYDRIIFVEYIFWVICFWYNFKAESVLKAQNKSAKWFNNVKTEWLVNGTTLKITIDTARPSPANNGDALLDFANENQLSNFYDMQPLYQAEEKATVILAPMYGGIWTLCISLTGILIVATKNFKIFFYEAIHYYFSNV